MYLTVNADNRIPTGSDNCEHQCVSTRSKTNSVYLSLLAAFFILISCVSGKTFANSDTHWVDVVYIVPSDFPDRGRAEERVQYIMESMRLIQRQWSEWGYSFRLDPNPIIDYSSQPCSYYRMDSGQFGGQNAYERIGQDVEAVYGYPSNVIRNVFIECSQQNGAAAIGGTSPRSTQYYAGVTNDMVVQGRSGAFIQAAGVIGHEMGHAFHMPHENCNGEEPGNAEGLRNAGLPDYGTLSLMCNSRWPNVNPPEPWMRDRLHFDGGCDWFYECSGGSSNPVPVEDAFNGGSPILTNAGLCLDVAGAGTANGTNIQQYSCNGTAAQNWTLVPSGPGFMLRSDRSGKCVDVDGGSTDTGANIQQWDCVGVGQQTLIPNGNTLSFFHSGKCLDVAGGSNQSGANVQQWDCNGSAAQQFTVQGVQNTFSLSIADVTVYEGESSSLQLFASSPVAAATTVELIQTGGSLSSSDIKIGQSNQAGNRFVIPAGQSSATGVIQAFADGNAEGSESATYTLNVVQGFGNTSGALNVTVWDVVTVTPPADLTIEATGELTQVDIGIATVSDGSTPVNNAPSDGFPPGTTTVRWESADGRGFATQLVTVVEAQDPPEIIVDPPEVVESPEVNETPEVEAEGPDAPEVVDNSSDDNDASEQGQMNNENGNQGQSENAEVSAEDTRPILTTGHGGGPISYVWLLLLSLVLLRRR